MAAPKYEVIQVEHQNPHATKGLKLTVVVVSNTPDEVIQDNIKHSSKKYDKWLQSKPEHDGVAVLIGGGDSINGYVNRIKAMQNDGATIFAMNGSSKWARQHGIVVDYQIIIDAKEETSTLVDQMATEHIFASQCHSKTLEAATNLTLTHFLVEDIESFFPPEKVTAGGYVLLGGGSTVGNVALAAAYSQGFREMHIFGYDSSHSEGASHAYPQLINVSMPTTNMTWAGKTYQTSIGMKSQAERFPMYAKQLEESGCELHVYGEGLLQTIYNTRHEDLTEREKYQLMWQTDTYRACAPGEYLVNIFLEQAKPEGLVIDFGCGTGRASLKLKDAGLDVMLVDFTDNCRDDEAIMLPFLKHDLTEEIPISAKYGYCTDVMEHIQPENVDRVLRNIRAATDSVFYQISLVDDVCGALIGQPLHLSVHPYDWWLDKFSYLGYEVQWSEDCGETAMFYLTK